MLGIDILETLFNETADISLEMIIALEFLNLDDDKSPFECAKCSKVFDLPSTILEGKKFFL
jgi:hypothetical protein